MHDDDDVNRKGILSASTRLGIFLKLKKTVEGIDITRNVNLIRLPAESKIPT